jgi:ABC-2 type transport system ATP-binding protein
VTKISIIEVKGLTKVFNGDLTAVDNISFTVEEGEIFGFLGPNGAGKTTTLNMLATLLRPTSGTATVNGFDILKEPDNVRRSIGFVFQDPTLDIELTGRENLDFHGRIYGLTKKQRQERIEEILEVVQLTERANAYVKTYSGGMKRRLEIGRGLLHYPKVLFLDEPTLGLDPQTRRAIWEYIQRLNQEHNVTIILTTHYTEEADHLCKRIQIIDFGKIVALDTTENLKARLEGDIVSLTFPDAPTAQKLLPVFQDIKWVTAVIPVPETNNQGGMAGLMGMMMSRMRGGGMGNMMPAMGTGGNGHAKTPPDMEKIKERFQTEMLKHRRLNLRVDDAGTRIPEIIKLIDNSGVQIEKVEMHKPTLDDVFLSVTGRSIRDEKGSMMQMFRRHRMVRQARGQRTPR